MSYRVVKIYTQALYEASEEQKKLEAIHKDIRTLQNVFATSTDFKNFCLNPAISLPIRVNILQEIFKDKIEKLTQNFLLILAQKNRLRFLEDICQYFNDIFAEK